MQTLPKISPEIIAAYEAEMKNSGSKATAKRKLISLNRFFDWAKGAGHMENNPIALGKTNEVTVTSAAPKRNALSVANFAKVGMLIGLTILVFALTNKLSFPIPFVFTPAKEGIPESKIQTLNQNQLDSPVPDNEPSTPDSNTASSAENGSWKLFANLKLSGPRVLSFNLYKTNKDSTPVWSSEPQEIKPDTEGSSLISLEGVPTDLFFGNNTLSLGIEESGKEIIDRIPVSTANTPVIGGDGKLILAGESPTVKGDGNLLIEGSTVTIKTTDGGDGNIEINPDGHGIAHFLFEGTGKNFLNAQGPNMSSGSLYYGIVANNSLGTGYDLLRLQSGSHPTTKFSVDGSGNTFIDGKLTVDNNINITGNGGLQVAGVTRLTNLGRLASITGYYQDSGLFQIDQGVPDSAKITKVLSSSTGASTADTLTLTLDESTLSTGSGSDTLVLNRLGGALDGLALFVDNGNAKFDGQLQLGNFTSNPTAIGAGSLVFNTTDSQVYVWDGTAWTAVGASGGSPPFDAITSGTNTTATMVVGTGASLSTTGGGTISATDLTCTGCVSNSELANSTITFIGDSGSSAISLGGSETINGSNGITTSQSGSTLTITGTNATTSTVGVASFDSNFFSVIAGNVSVLNDSLDFAQFKDSMTLDAATDIATDGLTLSTSGTGALNFASSGQVSFAGNVDAANGVDVTNDSTLTASGFFSLGDNGETGLINTSDWDINTSGDLTGIGSIGADGDITLTQATPTISFVDSTAASDDYTVNVDGSAFTIVDSTDGRTELAFAGDGAITLGSATATTITLATDSTGNGEVVLPDDSIGPNEIHTSGQSDEYCLTYETTGGTFEWQNCGSSAAVSWSSITDPTSDLTLAHSTWNTVFNWDPGADSAETNFSLTTQGEDTLGSDEDQVLLALSQTSNGADVTQAADALLTLANNDSNDPVVNAIRFDAGAAGTDFTYGINFDAASIGTAELVLQNAETIDNTVDGTVTITSPTTALTGDLTFTDDNWLGLGSSAGLIEFDDQAVDEVNILNAKVGIGDNGPDAFLEVLGTTEQLRLTYTDGTVDSRFTVDSSGNLTIDNTGTDTIFSDDITVSGGNINTGNIAFTIGDVTTDTITFTTDGTGDGEIVLPNDSIGVAEINDNGATPTDEYCLTYESTGGIFEWAGCSSSTPAWNSISDPAGDLTLNMATYNTTFNWDPGADTDEVNFSLTTQGEDDTSVSGDNDQVLLALSQTANGANVTQAADALLTFANNDSNDPVVNAIRFDAGGAGTDFTYGINFDAADIGTAEIVLENAEQIHNQTNGTITLEDGSGTDYATFSAAQATLTGDLAVNGGDITSTGSLTVTPGAGTNLNIVLSTTGDFAVNTDDLYVDTSTGNVGIGVTDTLGYRLWVDNTSTTDTTAFASVSEFNPSSDNLSFDPVYIGSNISASSTRPIAEVRGMYTEAVNFGSGAISNMTTLEVLAENGGTGVITDEYGIFLGTDSTGPTVTNSYDIYLYSAGTGFGIYQAGSSRNNYFAGKVGIGDTTPVATLTVGNGDLFQVAGASGNITTAGDLALNGDDITTDGTLTITPTTTLTLNSTGDMTLDSSTDIILDADGADIFFKDNGTTIATFTNSSTDLTIDVAGGQLYLANGDTINIGGVTGLTYNALSDSGTTGHALASDNDLYIEGDQELDGILYLDGRTISNPSGTATIILPTDPITTAATLTASNWLVENTANVGQAALMVNQTKDGDIFTASTSGVPKFVITNAGDVGIGITTPTTRLDVRSARAATLNSLAIGTNSGTGSDADAVNMLFVQAGSGGNSNTASAISSVLETAAFSKGALTFSTGVSGVLTERMRIMNGGNVGIGDTTPTAVLNLYGNNNASGEMMIIEDTGVTPNIGNYINFKYNDQNSPVDGNEEAIGGLTFQGTYDSSGTYNPVSAAIRAVATQGFTVSAAGTRLGFFTTPTSSTTLTERVRMDNRLMVIGSSDTAAGGAGTEGIFKISTGTGATTDNQILFGLHDSDYAWIQAVKPGSTYNNLILNSAGGDVGIGTGTSAPSTALHIKSLADNNVGLLKLESSNNNSGLSLWTSGGSTMRNWQIQNNYNVAGDLVIMRSTTNTGDPTTLVMEFDTSGNVGIGDSTPDALFDLDSTATTTDAFGILASSLTTGSAMVLTGPTSTGVTDNFVKLTSDVGSGASLLQLTPDFSGSAVTGIGLNISATDSTANANSDYGVNVNLTLTGNANKTGIGVQAVITDNSTTADTLFGEYISPRWTGAISTGTRTNLGMQIAPLSSGADSGGSTVVYGILSQPNISGANTGGTTTIYGVHSNPISTNATTGSTTTIIGFIADTSGTLTTGGTMTQYGVYIANGTSSTTGTSAKTGLYMEDQTGADTNYSAIFSSTTANVGIGDTSPTGLLTVGNGDLFTVDSAGQITAIIDGNATAVDAICGDSGLNGDVGDSSSLISDCSGAPTVDYAEIYPTKDGIEYGDIVATSTEIVQTKKVENTTVLEGQYTSMSKLEKSTSAYQTNVIGITSNNYGDFTSTGHGVVDDADHPLPVALNGRVPLKVSSVNGDINVGDFITTSNIPGVGMKATSAGSIIGTALTSYSNSDPNAVGGITVFVRLGYADPNIAINSPEDLNIAQGTNNNYTLTNNSNGNLIDKIGAFAKVIAANIKTGLIEAQDFVSPKVSTTLISPIPGDDLAIKLTPESKLKIVDQNLAEVASFDNLGNATFSGTVKAKNIDEIQELLSKVEADQALLAEAQNWNNNTATESAEFNQLIATDLFVTGQAAFNSLSISQSITIGNDLVLGSSGNTINTLSSSLQIQSLGLADVEIMRGLVKIDTFGNVNIAGDLFVAGKIESKGIDLKDVGGNTISSIDASGSASFKNLAIDGLTIATGASESGEIVNGEISTNSTVGKAVIATGSDEITIRNPKITDYSLIYVTPTSETQNLVLYVKEKGNGYVKVGFDRSLDIDVSFNWWIVEVSQ